MTVDWTAGALDTHAAMRFLSVGERLFRAIAAAQKWPRKYQGTKVLYPKSAVAAYLAALPSEPPAELKRRSERLRAKKN